MSDKQNNRINTLQSFAESFMRPCQLAKMISRYMIINETDRILMAMRPYQVYAVEALIQQATETGNNGYVWHTTGSGKTLTSFKASQILSQQDDIKKVIFWLTVKTWIVKQKRNLINLLRVLSTKLLIPRNWYAN